MNEESDFNFSSDETARESMKKFIRTNFEDQIDNLDEILAEPDWYEKLHEELQEKIEQSRKGLPKNLNKMINLIKDRLE